MGKPFVDLTGKRFGRWAVERQADDLVYQSIVNGKPRTARYSQWLCKCDCGAEKVVLGTNLTRGRSKSCGCYKLEVLKQQNGKRKQGANYKSLPNPPSLDTMLRVMLGDKYNAIPESKRMEAAIKAVFYNCWFKFVRDEQTTIRRNKKSACDICGKPCVTELHHIRPVSEYGGNEAENILWLCHECHREIERKRATGNVESNENPSR